MTRDPVRAEPLRRGVVLRSVVCATMMAREPDVSRFMNWDGQNYALNNADGTYAAISFVGPDIVGVFFDSASRYNPYLSNANYDIEVFIRGMPPHLRSLTETRALQYNRQNYRGRFVALVTAAFWSDGEYLTAAFPWEDVLRHGAHIVRVELLGDTDAAWSEWQDRYQCSPEELAFARSVFERKLLSSQPVMLTRREVEWLRQRSRDPGAYADSLRAFERLGVRPPD